MPQSQRGIPRVPRASSTDVPMQTEPVTVCVTAYTARSSAPWAHFNSPAISSAPKAISGPSGPFAMPPGTTQKHLELPSAPDLVADHQGHSSLCTHDQDNDKVCCATLTCKISVAGEQLGELAFQRLGDVVCVCF